VGAGFEKQKVEQNLFALFVLRWKCKASIGIGSYFNVDCPVMMAIILRKCVHQ
jgi:hypothetical protein